MLASACVTQTNQPQDNDIEEELPPEEESNPTEDLSKPDPEPTPGENEGECAHNLIYDAVKAPTCTESGVSGGWHCSDCGKVTLVQDILPPIGHEWEAKDSVESSCFEYGKIPHYECTRTKCSAVSLDGENECALIEILTEKAPHTWGEPVEKLEDTCITVKAHRKCAVCTAYLDIAASDASGREVTVRESDIYLPPRHVWDENARTLITQPTCTTDGRAIDVCRYCSLREEHGIDALGHNNLAYVSTVYPTCELDGYLVYKCQRCKHSATEVILTPSDIGEDHEEYATNSALNLEKFGHSIEGVRPIRIYATCTENGLDLYRCIRYGSGGCSHSVRVIYDEDGSLLYPANGHSIQPDGKCSICGESDE